MLRRLLHPFYIFTAHRHLYYFVSAAHIYQIALVNTFAKIFLNQPGIAEQLRHVCFINPVFVLCKFVIQRGHRIVFQQKYLIHPAPQVIIGQVLVQVFGLYAQPFTQIIFVAL